MNGSGSLLATGDDKGRVILWDVELRESRGAAELHSQVSALAFDRLGRHIYAATHGGVTQALWAASMREAWSTHAEGEFVIEISPLDRSCALVTTISDQHSPYSVSYEVRFISADTGSVYASVAGIRGEPLVVVADASQRVMFRDSQAARIYTSLGHAERELTGDFAGGLSRMSVSSTGDCAVLRDNSGTRFWRTDSSRATLLPRLPGWGAITISSDGYYIANEFDGDIYIYRTDTEPPQQVMELHGPNVLAMDFRFDGERLLVSSVEGTVMVYDVRTGHVLERMRHGHREVQLARYSSTGDRVLTWSVDGWTGVWSGDGALIFDLKPNPPGPR